MPNLWLKKNPFMSMWLSAANRMFGSMRVQATAQVKRERNSAVTRATNDKHLKAALNTKASTSSTTRTRARARARTKIKADASPKHR